jgi:hypothetical protein
MATYDLAFHTRLDGYAVMQTFVETGIQVSDSVVIAGASHGFNATADVVSTDPYLFLGVSDEGDLRFDYGVIMQNQFIYVNNGADFERDTATGTVTYTVTPSWTTSALVLSALGIDVATANDTAYIAKCVSASNFWCWNKRRESNYTDSPSTVPNASVELAATLYAMQLYRERGTSGDAYAGFDGMGNLPMPVNLSRIMQLLGCSRATVA